MYDLKIRTLIELEDAIKEIRIKIGENKDLNLDVNLNRQIILFNNNGTYIAKIQVEKIDGYV